MAADTEGLWKIAHEICYGKLVVMTKERDDARLVATCLIQRISDRDDINTAAYEAITEGIYEGRDWLYDWLKQEGEVLL